MLFVLALIGLVVVAIIATVLTETEKFGWATILLLISVVSAQLCQVVDILGFISTHALLTIVYTLGYVAVGVVWSFIKWFSFLLSARDKYRELKIQFLTKRGLTSEGQVPEDKLADFTKFLRDSLGYYASSPFVSLLNGLRPRASDNKSRIVSWMSLWPCSVIGTIFNDPVRRLCTWLFNAFKALYQKMADRVFAADAELK